MQRVHYLRAGDDTVSAMAPQAPVALRDPLTGLLNKHGFIREGNRLLPMMVLAGEHPHVVFIELNNYEGIVSRMEYEEALELLHAMRRRLELAFGDDVLLARLDSERFVALLPDAGDSLEALNRALEAPVVIGSHAYHLSITCGVASYPEAADDMQQPRLSSFHHLRRSLLSRSRRRYAYAGCGRPHRPARCRQ